MSMPNIFPFQLKLGLNETRAFRLATAVSSNPLHFANLSNFGYRHCLTKYALEVCRSDFLGPPCIRVHCYHSHSYLSFSFFLLKKKIQIFIIIDIIFYFLWKVFGGGGGMIPAPKILGDVYPIPLAFYAPGKFHVFSGENTLFKYFFFKLARTFIFAITFFSWRCLVQWHKFLPSKFRLHLRKPFKRSVEFSVHCLLWVSFLTKLGRDL